jgi:hypothetical protein
MPVPLRPSGEPDPIAEPGRPGSSASLAALVAQALVAFEALADLGETVDGEWQYVTDLRSVYGAELRGLAAADPEHVAAGDTVVAIEAVIDEVALITDPHRAIDWLSTFPQVVRLSLAAETASA